MIAKHLMIIILILSSLILFGLECHDIQLLRNIFQGHCISKDWYYNPRLEEMFDEQETRLLKRHPAFAEPE